MPHFSRISRERLLTCDSRIITVCSEVIGFYDFSVLCGHRGEAAQNAAYANHHSQLRWPHSLHNTYPSLAIDLAPWPIDWDDLYRFHELAGAMLYVARSKGIEMEWGGHWPRFKDLPHFQVPPRTDTLTGRVSA